MSRKMSEAERRRDRDLELAALLGWTELRLGFAELDVHPEDDWTGIDPTFEVRRVVPAFSHDSATIPAMLRAVARKSAGWRVAFARRLRAETTLLLEAVWSPPPAGLEDGERELFLLPELFKDPQAFAAAVRAAAQE